MNLDVPEAPTVVAGSPPQNSIAPAIPPQIDKMATFVSWETRATLGSSQVVPVTACGFTEVFAGERAFTGVLRSRRVLVVSTGEDSVAVVKRKSVSERTLVEICMLKRVSVDCN